MPKRIEHFPATQLEEICRSAMSGTDIKMTCDTRSAAMKLANTFWRFRGLMRTQVEKKLASGQLAEMPFGLEETGCFLTPLLDGRIEVTFSSRENNESSKIFTAALKHKNVEVVEGKATPIPPAPAESRKEGL